jgi:L-iditol 2-dehydrogenase
MKAVVLTGIRKAELVEAPDVRITKPDDVLLKVGAVGLCGSDVHYYTDGKVGSQVVIYPYRVGHEFSGTVAAVGRKVNSLKIGDRVAVDPAMPCGKCDQCRAGRRHTCRKLKFLGCPGQAEGCLSEYMVMPDHCCLPIKKKTSFEQAAIVEPLSIGLYAVKLGGKMKNARIGILGVGPIGLSVLVCARTEGARKIYVTDKIDLRLAVALKAGADWAGNPDKQDIVAEIGSREPLLLDVVLECCGKQEGLGPAVKLLKPGGKLVLVGIPTVNRISFSIDEMRRKEICLQNVRRQNECAGPALKLIESGRVKVDFMVTHRFPLERTPEAFDMVENYRDGVVKAMIAP